VYLVIFIFYNRVIIKESFTFIFKFLVSLSKFSFEIINDFYKKWKFRFFVKKELWRLRFIKKSFKKFLKDFIFKFYLGVQKSYVEFGNFYIISEDEYLFKVLSSDKFHYYTFINQYGLNHLNLFRAVYVELLYKLEYINYLEDKEITIYGVNFDGVRFKISSYIYFDPYIPFEEFYLDMAKEFTKENSLEGHILQLDALHKVEIQVKILEFKKEFL
jgi:hypothetical protein